MNTIIPHSYFEALNLPMDKKKKIVSKPIFPKFKKLEIEDREWMEEYIQKYPPYSDFNFVSLWNYNINDQAEISMLNNNLVIKFQDYITAEPFYTFLGTNKVKETVGELFTYARINQITTELKLIPEVTINEIRELQDYFLLQEDVDNHDYIFSIEEHKDLKGQRYKDKRNLVNRFKKENSYSVIAANLSDKKIQKEIIGLFLIWEKVQKKDPRQTKHEFTAIQRAFKSLHKFSLFCILIYSKQIIVGFAIGEIIHDNYAISHFEKTNNLYTGISSLLRQEVAKYLHEKGCKYLNYEQDLGIAGLRKAKKLWLPSHLLKKYRLTLK